GVHTEPKLITDDRFAAANSDTRFIEPARKRSKVEIDSRFGRLFSDSKFGSSNAPVDKRGKPIRREEAGSSLKRYYRLQDEGQEKRVLPVESDNNEAADDASNAESEQLQTESESESEKLEVNSDASEDEGQSSDQSTASSSADSDDGYADEDEEDTFMQMDDVPEIDKETRRLALVNLDWSQIRAVDILVMLNSFLPKGGEISSVAVYPSEFGIKRMEEEAVRGPVGLFDGDEDEDDNDENDDEIDKKKLRAYELSRLKYYYAVVEFDSTATADYIYKACDGVEFERSANKLDLRFIPDSMEFKHEPRDVATEAPPSYEGLDFQTRALQHSNIDLTWDEDEPQRKKTFKRKINEKQLAELELKEYLASDESESDDDDGSGKKNEKIDKYRALIQSGDGSDEEEEKAGGDMEVTFNSELEDLSKRILQKDKKSESVWKESLRKAKERRKASRNRGSSSEDDDDSDAGRDVAEEPDDFFVEDHEAGGRGGKRGGKKTTTSSESSVRNVKKREGEASVAELELLTADDDGNGPSSHSIKGYNLKPAKIKRMKGSTDEAKLPSAGFDDPRFSSLFTSPLFALDPTDPQFKR
ncbi:hypothetical protein M569_13607, partial [Genlisea aurea]